MVAGSVRIRVAAVLVVIGICGVGCESIGPLFNDSPEVYDPVHHSEVVEQCGELFSDADAFGLVILSKICKSIDEDTLVKHVCFPISNEGVDYVVAREHKVIVQTKSDGLQILSPSDCK